MNVDLIRLLKLSISNPATQRILLMGLSRRDPGLTLLEQALNAYSGASPPRTVRSRVYTALLQIVLDTSLTFFRVNRHAFREYLQSPLVRRGVMSVLKGIAKYGVTKPQILSAPFLVVWNLTSMCNLKCKHCYQKAESPLPDELTLEEKRRVIHELAAAGVVIIALSGGEPLLHPHFFPVVKEITKCGMYSAVATNGTLITREMARRLKEARVQNVEISLDSVNPQIHDAFRGVPGAWTRTIKGIKHCVSEGLYTAIATTITQTNRTEVPALIALAKTLGAHRFLHFNFIPTGRGVAIADLDLSPEEREKLLRALYHQATISGIEVLSTAPQYSRVVLQQSGGQDMTPSHFYIGLNRGHELNLLAEFVGGCGSCRLYCAIQPNGEITPCVFIPQWIIGNLQEEGFSEIWDKVDQDIDFECFRDRDSLSEPCASCKYKYLCGGCRARAIAYFNDPSAPDIGCIYNQRLWQQVLASHKKISEKVRLVDQKLH